MAGDPNPNGYTMPNWLAGLLGAGGAAAGLFPNNQQTNTSGNGTTDSWSNNATDTSSAQQFQQLINSLLQSSTQGGQTQTTTPNLSPEHQAFINNLMNKFSSQSSTITPDRIAALQAQQINASAAPAAANLDANLAARGLSTSPVAGASAAMMQNNRMRQINQAQNQAPLTANALNLQNLTSALPLISAIPHGATTSGTQFQDSTQTGEQGTSGQSTGQQQTSSQSIGQQKTVQQQQEQVKKGGGIGGLLSGGISSIIAMLPFLSDETLKHDITEVDTKESLDKIAKLSPKAWKWNKDNTGDVGVIAQEIKEVMPELVRPNEDGNLTVNYIGLIPHLIGAVQHLSQGAQ